MREVFPQKLRDLRQDRNLTQAQLAEILHYTQSNISEWEKGSVEPKATALYAIASFFGVSVDYLLGLEDDFGVRIIEPINNNYTSEERRIIDEYRKLPDSSKVLVRRMVGIKETAKK